MTAPRLSDWPTKLADYLGSVANSDGSPEAEYCALFAAGAVEAITGTNPAKQFRGRYSEVAGKLEETIDGLFPVCPPAFARRGDLAMHDGAIGVVDGGEALFVGREEGGDWGFARIPRDQWAKAWRVGL